MIAAQAVAITVTRSPLVCKNDKYLSELSLVIVSNSAGVSPDGTLRKRCFASLAPLIRVRKSTTVSRLRRLWKAVTSASNSEDPILSSGLSVLIDGKPLDVFGYDKVWCDVLRWATPMLGIYTHLAASPIGAFATI